jgi:pimeloyl-ACP methyl ester carboxylesterase
MQAETRYADSGGVNIAYQTLGKGPQDLVFVPGWASNIEVYQEEPAFARFVSRLTSFTRLILFDKRDRSLGPGRGYAESRSSHGRRARRYGRRGFRTRRSAYRREEQCLRSLAQPILSERQP